MLPYQKKRFAARQQRITTESDIAREIKKQHPEKNWYQCLAEAKKELGHR